MRSIELISRPVAVMDSDKYCEWVDTLDADDTHEGLSRFTLTDWYTVVQGGIVEYWDGVACTLCPAHTAGLTSSDLKAVLVCDGYVYGLESWEELDALQREHSGE